jgi:hypothetical protein
MSSRVPRCATASVTADSRLTNADDIATQLVRSWQPRQPNQWLLHPDLAGPQPVQHLHGQHIVKCNQHCHYRPVTQHTVPVQGGCHQQCWHWSTECSLYCCIDITRLTYNILTFLSCKFIRCFLILDHRCPTTSLASSHTQRYHSHNTTAQLDSPRQRR